MIVNKTFHCNTTDIDKVVLELAKEIRNSWHIIKVEVDPPHISTKIKNPISFSITLEQERGGYYD